MRWIVALVLLVGACGSDRPTAPRPVVVFAAASLKDLLTEVAAEVEARSGREVRLQLEASSTLARQIEAGAPADVFVTASPEWLARLDTVSRFDWLSNALVVVARRGASEGKLDLKDAPSLAMASEQVPAGKYARAALASLKVPPPERTIYGANVRDVLAKVSQGGAAAGIVYATDAAIDPGVEVVHTFPAGSHPKIVYAVGVLSEEGRAFAASLREPASIRAAVARGFLALE